MLNAEIKAREEIEGTDAVQPLEVTHSQPTEKEEEDVARFDGTVRKQLL